MALEVSHSAHNFGAIMAVVRQEGGGAQIVRVQFAINNTRSQIDSAIN